MRISRKTLTATLAGLAFLAPLSACGDDGSSFDEGSGGFIEIQDPTLDAAYTTDNPAVQLHGRADMGNWEFISGNEVKLDCVVTWSNAATGDSGTAQSYTTGWFLIRHEWSATIPLAMGDNFITVISTSGCGVGMDNIRVTRVPDRTPPSVWFDRWASTIAHATPYQVIGTVSDNIGVVSMSWANLATGASGTMPVESPWTLRVELAPGDNTLKVFATDAAGFTGEATLTVRF